MGAGCSRTGDRIAEEVSAADIPDPEIYEYLKKSIRETQPGSLPNQHHLLFKQQQLQQRTGKIKTRSKLVDPTDWHLRGNFSTRLLVRRHAVRQSEEGFSGTHIYAVRMSGSDKTVESFCQEQCPKEMFTDDPIESLVAQEDRLHQRKLIQQAADEPRQSDPILSINHLFQPSTMSSAPKRKGTLYHTVRPVFLKFVSSQRLGRRFGGPQHFCRRHSSDGRRVQSYRCRDRTGLQRPIRCIHLC